MNLNNKIVIITGGNQGLGEVLAYKIANLGAQVILIARRENLLKKVKDTIVTRGGKAEYYSCDIRDPQKIKNTTGSIIDKYPSVDILINNAGIWTDDNLEEKRPELRRDTLETNTLGHIQLTKELLPLFKKQNYGYIFNVISTSGIGDITSGNNTLWQTYGASKWAMTGFTKALKESLEETKIKVTSFHPGGFESNLYENAGRENPHNQPWMMKTEDVADIIVFALTRPSDVLMEKIVVTKIQ